MALLANVLTIALSGLFQQSFVYLSDGLMLHPLHLVATKMNASWHGTETAMDTFYIADTNITAGAALPPWVTPERYFVPFELPSSTGKTTRYRAITTAVSAELHCEAMHSSQGRHVFNLTLDNNATGATLTTSHLQPGGTILQCQADVGWLGNPEGTNAAEVLTLVAGNNDTGSIAQSAFCQAQIVAGWIRSNITLEAPSSNHTVVQEARKTTSASLDSATLASRSQCTVPAPFWTVDR